MPAPYDATFPEGTTTVFNMDSAPTGWTKLTTWDQYALRVTSGTGGGTGGTVNFGSVYTSQTFAGTVSVSFPLGGTGPSLAPTPAHTHPGAAFGSNSPTFTVTTFPGSNTLYAFHNPDSTASYGTGGDHSHPAGIGGTWTGNTVDFSVKYLDVCVCQRQAVA